MPKLCGLRSPASVVSGTAAAIGLYQNTWLGSCLQKMWTVTGQNSLDAELGGCGMLLENFASLD